VTLQVSLQFAPDSLGQPTINVVRAARFRFTPHTPTFIRLFIPLSLWRASGRPARCADGHTPCTVSEFCQGLVPAQTCGDNGSCTPVDITPQPLGPTEVHRSTRRWTLVRRAARDLCAGVHGANVWTGRVRRFVRHL